MCWGGRGGGGPGEAEGGGNGDEGGVLQSVGLWDMNVLRLYPECGGHQSPELTVKS